MVIIHIFYRMHPKLELFFLLMSTTQLNSISKQQIIDKN